MGFELGVRHPLGLPAPADHRVGRGQRGGDVTVFAVQFGDDVAGRVGQAAGGGVLLAVQQRGAGLDRLCGVEDRGQQLVFHHQQAAGVLGDGDAVGDDGGDPLAAVTHHGVEDQAVVWVVEPALVPGGGEQGAGGVGGAEHGVHPGQGAGGGGVEREHPGVGVWAPQIGRASCRERVCSVV